ncbi:MAG: MBL fold metallo-hydrolase [Clostridia bacterium]|nr:MBL fold metallo-hydrolase [Clostridia bacterium]
MKIKVFSNGLLNSNEYLVWNAHGGRGAVIDCGNRARAVADFAEENGIKVEYIILTHSHYDHAHYVSEYIAAFPGAKLLCHADETALLSDPTANLSAYFGEATRYPDPDVLLKNGDNAVICGDKPENDLVFRVMDAPGHTPGSFCLICDAEQIMFCGDVIFKCGIGRTDFAYGSEEDMLRSLRRILSLPDRITFYPGHGEPSTVGTERARYRV